MVRSNVAAAFPSLVTWVRAGMPIVVRNATIIEGGSLKNGQPWVPRITRVDGVDFVSLSRMDRALASLCGQCLKQPHPLRDCVWISMVATMRRDAVNAWKVATVGEEVATVGEDGIFADYDVAQPRNLADLPPILVLPMSPLKGDDFDMEGINMRVLSEKGDNTKVVSIELTAQAVEYMVHAIKLESEWSSSGERKRRPVAERVVPEDDSEGQGINRKLRYNYQRATPYKTTRDGDGRWHYKTVRVERSHLPDLPAV
jgi:hypothetical protein